MSPLRTLFYGTSSFAVPALEHLLREPRIEIVAVITQPDKPVGRHAEVIHSPVKQVALAHGLTMKQYASIKEPQVQDELSALTPDIAVVVSFGQIIPSRILNLPRHGSINIHGSLLPKYRGSSPINAAILAGDTETGVTIMKMDAKMDHGPILVTFPEPIHPNDTADLLHDRLAEIGGKEIVDVLIKYSEGKITPQEQIEEQATYVKLLSREDGEINWNDPASLIERKIRAYHPWPGTYTFFEKQRLKILAAHLVQSIPQEAKTSEPGTTLIQEESPVVVCGRHDILCLDQVQPEGKKPMSGKDFLRGKPNWAQQHLSTLSSASRIGT